MVSVSSNNWYLCDLFYKQLVVLTVAIFLSSGIRSWQLQNSVRCNRDRPGSPRKLSVNQKTRSSLRVLSYLIRYFTADTTVHPVCFAIT